MSELRDIKILLTAVGCPGASTSIKQLKSITERNISIVGTDMKDNVIGKFLCDSFYVVPAASNDNFIQSIIEIVDKEKPDLIFPASSFDVGIFSENREIFEEMGVRVMCSKLDAIAVSNNKFEMYELLRKNNYSPLPPYRKPNNISEFINYVHELGYPDKEICFKPNTSKGGRGFRIINDNVSRLDTLLNSKLGNVYISLEESISIFRESEVLPDIILMPVIAEPHYDAMSICFEGKELLTTIKTREDHRAGTITQGALVENDELVSLSRKILSHIHLSYNISIQFIGNYLLEINPRTSTYIYQDDLIEPYLSIKLCLGEYKPEDIEMYRSKVDFGRRMVRYFDQHCF